MKGLLDALLGSAYGWAGAGVGGQIGIVVGGPLSWAGLVLGGIAGGIVGAIMGRRLAAAITDSLMPPCREECPSASGPGSNGSGGGPGTGRPSTAIAC